MDKKILADLGLTEGEIKVIFALFKIGECSGGQIIKETGLQSSAIYFILDRLIKEGIITYITKNKMKYYSINKEGLKEFLKNKKESIDEITKELDKIKEKEEKSDARIFIGFRGMKSVSKRMIKTLQKGDEVLIIGSFEVFPVKKFEILFQQEELERKKKRIKMRILHSKKTKGYIKKGIKYGALTKSRYLEQETPAGIVIYKNFVDIYVFKPEEKVFQIEDKKVADSYRQYFEILWKQAKP